VTVLWPAEPFGYCVVGPSIACKGVCNMTVSQSLVLCPNPLKQGGDWTHCAEWLACRGHQDSSCRAKCCMAVSHNVLSELPARTASWLFPCHDSNPVCSQSDRQDSCCILFSNSRPGCATGHVCPLSHTLPFVPLCTVCHKRLSGYQLLHPAEYFCSFPTYDESLPGWLPPA